jgi:hypothetical protein
VEVASSNNGTDFSSYGTMCTITTPAFPITKIQSSQCGSQIASSSTAIYCDFVSAAKFRYHVTGDSYDETIILSTRWFFFSNLPGIGISKNYQVEVAVSIDGTNFGAYGASCQITSPGLATTKVQTSQCGTTLGSIWNATIADAVTGATHYRFLVTGTGYNQTVTKTARLLYLQDLPSYKLQTTYNVSVAVSNDGVNFNAYGTVCTITTPPLPTTKIQTSQCGSTLTSTAQAIIADNGNASHYRFRVLASGYEQFVTKTSRLLYLNDLPFYSANTAYSISVSLSNDGVNYGVYGSACSVTTPGIPVTQIRALDCNTTLATNTTPVYADLISATRYRYHVTGTSYDQTITLSTRWFRLSNLPNFTQGTTYSVRVAVSLDGVNFGAYGSSCNITTPASAMVQNPNEEVLSKFETLELNAYPNPSNGDFTISSSHEGTFNIINELGQLIQTVEITKENNYQVQIDGDSRHVLNQQLQPGIYFITGTINGNVLTSKIVIQ